MPEQLRAKVKATAILVNPDGVHQFEMVVPYETAEQLPALAYVMVMKLREDLGFFRPVGPLHFNYIPIERLRDLNIEVEPILLATDGNVAQAVADAKRQQSEHAGRQGQAQVGSVSFHKHNKLTVFRSCLEHPRKGPPGQVLSILRTQVIPGQPGHSTSSSDCSELTTPMIGRCCPDAHSTAWLDA